MDFIDHELEPGRELRPPDCHCELGERCRHCLPRALFAPRGGDGAPDLVDVAELYARDGLSCQCLEHERCRHCAPELAILAQAQAANGFAEARVSSSLGLIYTPASWLEDVAARN